ncbi:MAG: 3-deoxy-manno-octulosonate cytidylyltransferase (CMP-KDO synthetase) [Roseivirga sp.]|jgi:3-deoxy-manno-octulosonate cytidylyltransferase (CMP-KDO synthetase)
MKVVAMIPARYDASRFPGKLMAVLGTKSVILTTYQATVATGLFKDVYVVTDSPIIRDEIQNNNGKVIMSIEKHESGSDRIAEAALSIEADIIINVQGDEPFTQLDTLQKLIRVFVEDTDCKIDLASPMKRLTVKEQIENSNNVKVIVDQSSFAIYFSRSPIPFPRNKEIEIPYYKHIGIYAFRKQALLDFKNTPMTPLETAEKIECIRYLETGKKIKMVEIDHVGISIDSPEDLAMAKEYLASANKLN